MASNDVLLRYVYTLIMIGVELVLLPWLEFFFGLLLQPCLDLGGAVASASPCRGRCLFLVRSMIFRCPGIRILFVVASNFELAHSGLTSTVPLEILALVSSILRGFGSKKMSRGDHVQDLCVFFVISYFIRVLFITWVYCVRCNAIHPFLKKVYI